MSTRSSREEEDCRLTVYFDGACPLCRREINLYRHLKGAGSISWVDVSSEHAAELGPGLSPRSARRRFHVRQSDGQLLSGAAAFGELWLALPSLSWFGRAVKLPGVDRLAELLYRLFLKVRPYIQRMLPR